MKKYKAIVRKIPIDYSMDLAWVAIDIQAACYAISPSGVLSFYRDTHSEPFMSWPHGHWAGVFELKDQSLEVG